MCTGCCCAVENRQSLYISYNGKNKNHSKKLIAIFYWDCIGLLFNLELISWWYWNIVWNGQCLHFLKSTVVSLWNGWYLLHIHFEHYFLNYSFGIHFIFLFLDCWCIYIMLVSVTQNKSWACMNFNFSKSLIINTWIIFFFLSRFEVQRLNGWEFWGSVY